MKYTTLASGSSGNAIYVEGNKTRLLVDAGLSGKAIQQAMTLLGLDIQGLDGIIVTHEHIDHVRGVGVLARKYKLPVYASEGTWRGMQSLVGKILPEQVHFLEPNEKTLIKGLEIEPFATPHDANDPIGLLVSCGEKRLGIATDAGFVSRGMGRRLLDCQGIIFEANYDSHMLWHGSYPWSLKKRIAGEKGHLSNEDAGKALVKLTGGQTKNVLLAHLSKENNQPQRALETIGQILNQAQISFTYPVEAIDADMFRECACAMEEQNKPLRLSVAPRYEPHPLEEI